MSELLAVRHYYRASSKYFRSACCLAVTSRRASTGRVMRIFTVKRVIVIFSYLADWCAYANKNSRKKVKKKKKNSRVNTPRARVVYRWFLLDIFFSGCHRLSADASSHHHTSTQHSPGNKIQARYRCCAILLRQLFSGWFYVKRRRVITHCFGHYKQWSRGRACDRLIWVYMKINLKRAIVTFVHAWDTQGADFQI